MSHSHDLAADVDERDLPVLEALRRGDFASAKQVLAALPDVSDARRAELSAVCTVLAQPYVYGLAPMFEQADAEAKSSERTLGAVHGALARVAGRIVALRGDLAALLGEAAWLPALEPLQALSPLVDGTLDKKEADGDALALLWLLRREWTRLNWLLVGVGARSLSKPSSVGQPPERFDYLDTLLSARFNLLLDLCEESELTLEDELDRGMAESRWGGADGMLLKELSADLAGIWLEETSAALAAIRWLEGSHESPFDSV